jgi:alpha-galactosidase
MNNNLWINDPDALCIKDIDGQHIEPNDVHLQIATVLICGGIVTIGDRLGDYSHEDKELLRRIRDYTYYVKEVIPDEDFSTFTLNLKSKKERIKIYINWTGDNQTILIGQNSVNFMNNENLSSEYILPPADTLIVIEH